MDPSDQRRPVEDILQLIYEGTAAVTGDEFFRALVRATAAAMRVRWAFVSEFAGCRDQVRTLAFWESEAFAENIEYGLDGTVCEGVLQGELRYYPTNVARQFPREPELVELGVESYLATPMTNHSGDVLGHLAIFDDSPMDFSKRELEVFKVFGARAAAELDRLKAQAALHQSKARLTNILASAQDAIITINEDHRIELFNNAAERVFRCSADWAVGQSFDRFLSRAFRQLIGRYVDQTSVEASQVWAPEGITAMRADGEEFPIDATISPVTGDRGPLFIVILRDVNEREQAKREIKRLQSENLFLKEGLKREQRFAPIVGDSPAMRALFEQIEVVAPTDTSVLLIGETGTGKELIARALHERSARKDRLPVCVNCAALPGELVESELFGHEKGAFTGATAQRKGRFELANHGTIFLDEVGELSLQAQAKLLRVLQEQSFERVGGSTTLHVNVRLIAATNRDLGQMVQEGSFRDDLFYRLNVFPIRVPSLRDRPADIPLLARHFLAQMARRLAKPLHGIDQDSMERMMGYSWPGNVRELQNMVERAAILAQGPVVAMDDIVYSQPPAIASKTPESGTLDAVQRAHILEILGECGWRIEGHGGAAASLGLKPSTLRYRIHKLGIKREAPG